AFAGRGAAVSIPADELDRRRRRERDPDRNHESLPGRLLECFTAEEAQHRGIERPAERRQRVEDDERAPPEPKHPGAQRHGRPSARDETTERDQLSAALGEPALGPPELAPASLASIEASLDATAQPPSDEVRRVVADHGAGGRR